MEVEIPLDLSQIKSESLKSFLKTIEIHVIIKMEETDTEFILKDDYIVHKNQDYTDLPTKIEKKDLP
jgi:hypothetical protein